MTSTELTEDYRFDSAAEVDRLLRAADYLTDSKIATVVHLGDRLRKPVLVEGPAWHGKTELAKSVARVTGSRLIRLQCYEGLDEAKALYEWDYRKQLLAIQFHGTQSQGAERPAASARRSYPRACSARSTC